MSAEQQNSESKSVQFVVRLNRKVLNGIGLVVAGVVMGWASQYVITGPRAATSDANPDEVKARFIKFNPDIKVTNVVRSPVSGLFEVAFEQAGAVGYVDSSGKYVIPGFMVDAEKKVIASTLVNMGDIKPGAAVGQAPAPATPATSPGSAANPAVAMQSGMSPMGAAPTVVPVWELPESAALTWKHGSGKRRLVVFSDPQCVHCRALDAVLHDPAALPDTTVNLYPLAAISGSVQIATNVLCSEDPKAAWQSAIQAKPVAEHKDKGQSERCLGKILALDRIATQWGVNSTPTMFAANGMRLTGATTGSNILGFLDANPRN